VSRKQQTLTFRRWWIATILLGLREEAGLTVDAAAATAGLSHTAIYRAESGETVPTPKNLRDLVRAYRADEERLALLLELRRRLDDDSGWHQYRGVLPGDLALMISFETHAGQVLDYETSLIPGLLQTRAYAEAVIRTLPGITGAEVRRRLDVRMQRQQTLAGRDPLTLHAIIDEAAIRRCVGGPEMMRDQLQALLGLPQNVTVRVISFATGEHAGMAGSFTVMKFRDERAPMAVFLEDNSGQRFAGGSADLSRFLAVWDALASAALSTKESARLVTAAADGST
jgi:transcriptional regulator with XRE-family HTH domain